MTFLELGVHFTVEGHFTLIAVDEATVVDVVRETVVVALLGDIIDFAPPCTHAPLLHHVGWPFRCPISTCCHHGGRCNDRSA